MAESDFWGGFRIPGGRKFEQMKKPSGRIFFFFFFLDGCMNEIKTTVDKSKANL